MKHFPYDWQRYITPSPFWITAKTNCVYYSMRAKQFESMMDSSPYFTQCVLGATTLNYLELVNKIQWMMDGDKTAQFCKWLLTYCIKKQGKSMIPKAFSHTSGHGMAQRQFLRYGPFVPGDLICCENRWGSGYHN